MYKYTYIETTWKELPDILKNATSKLNIKITDPENVVLGNSSTPGTLGNIIISYAKKYLVSFSPSDFSTSKFINNSIELFSNCTKLSGMCKLPSSITNAYMMFYGCIKIRNIDTSSFKNIVYANNMFDKCKNITNIDTSAFIKVTKAQYMFTGCTNLITINTSAFKNITDSSFMFEDCTKLASIDTSAFTNVTDASGMFSNCTKIKYIDTDSFKNVTKACSMFSFCISLNNIDTTALKNVKIADYKIGRAHV